MEYSVDEPQRWSDGRDADASVAYAESGQAGNDEITEPGTGFPPALAVEGEFTLPLDQLVIGADHPRRRCDVENGLGKALLHAAQEPAALAPITVLLIDSIWYVVNGWARVLALRLQHEDDPAVPVRAICWTGSAKDAVYHRERELVQARAERTRLRTAIERLLILVETGEIGARDPIFARRMSDNRSALAATTTRVDMLDTQLAKGSRRITATTVTKFGELLSEKRRDEDTTLCTAYLRMLVADVTVTRDEILICGPKAALENGVAGGVPRLEGTVPIFDRWWCRAQDSNL